MESTNEASSSISKRRKIEIEEGLFISFFVYLQYFKHSFMLLNDIIILENKLNCKIGEY